MALKYKVGDRVKAKSLNWYNENKNKFGKVWTSGGQIPFDKCMSKWCGKVMTISDVRADHYTMIEDLVGYWTDEMIEGLVEEETKNNNDMEEKEALLGWVKESDSLRLVPHKDYEIKHDGDNFYLVKKKKEYPKTYEECCKVLEIMSLGNGTDGYKWKILSMFQNLIICRDAYWKLYGEEMGLGKSWEPDWKNRDKKWVISRYRGELDFGFNIEPFRIFAFPTKEMQDAFYENFKELIEQCKELL